MSGDREREEKLSKTAGTGDIQCPFFHAHNRENIRCAGIAPGTLFVTARFENQEEKKFHQQTYCEGHYKKCWLYVWAMELMWKDQEE